MVRKEFQILLKVNGLTLGMWNRFSNMFRKSNLDMKDRKFYEACLNKISDIRTKYKLKGIQVKEIEDLFDGIKDVELPVQVSRAEYEKNKKEAIV